MRPAMLTLMAGVLAAVPVLAIVVLAIAGALAPGPALAAIAGIVLGAFGLAALGARDLARLNQELRLPAQGEPMGHSGWDTGLVWPPLAALARDVERLVRSLDDRTARTNRRLEASAAIVQLLPDPLVVLGADRSVVLANAAARAAFAAELPAVLRHPLLRAAIDRALAEGISQRAELALPAPVPRDLDLTAIPLTANSGALPPETGRVIVVLSDRTRERAVERMRADFVANVSHELRTPLTSLSGFIETLRGPAADDPPAQQRFLGIMAEQAARMNRLIDDLLSLSRIELIEHQPPSERVDLAVLIERITPAFEPHLREHGKELVLNVAADLPQVPGDADQLTQVLQNLLDNALKYGGKQVRLSAGPAHSGRWPARPGGVVIAVADDGPGIPREHLPRLTERFYRVDKGRSRRAGGTGLGLAIVKHIVNRHRGQLVIDSDEGRGSTFSVWLPVER